MNISEDNGEYLDLKDPASAQSALRRQGSPTNVVRWPKAAVILLTRTGAYGKVQLSERLQKEAHELIVCRIEDRFPGH